MSTTAVPSTASSKAIFYVSSVLILPALYVFFYILHVATHGSAIESWLPKWDRLLVIASIIVMERIYTYRYAVSQKAVFGRDIMPVRLSARGVLNRRCVATSCGRFCLVSI